MSNRTNLNMAALVSALALGGAFGGGIKTAIGTLIVGGIKVVLIAIAVLTVAATDHSHESMIFWDHFIQLISRL